MVRLFCYTKAVLQQMGDFTCRASFFKTGNKMKHMIRQLLGCFQVRGPPGRARGIQRPGGGQTTPKTSKTIGKPLEIHSGPGSLLTARSGTFSFVSGTWKTKGKVFMIFFLMNEAPGRALQGLTRTDTLEVSQNSLFQALQGLRGHI